MRLTLKMTFHLLDHCGMPHLVHVVGDRAQTAADHLRESLRRDALAARALDAKWNAKVQTVPETDFVLVLAHRRYMNG